MSTTVSNTAYQDSSDNIFKNPASASKLRILYIIAGVLFVAVIGLVIALVVVANDKTDTEQKVGQTNGQTIGQTAPDCPLNPASVTPELDKANCILDSYPLVDGHNDLAWRYRHYAQNKVYGQYDLRTDLTEVWTDKDDPSHTDIPRLRKGKVGAQFWSNYVTCAGQYKDAVRMTVDQMDVIKKFVERYPDTFTFVTTAQGILDAFADGKIGSLVGIEGGHSIDSSLGNLRMFYELGVRYMTLTHDCNTPWADNWKVDEKNYNAAVDGVPHNGLTEFGKKVVMEMNRLGMLVDLSHVAKQTMIDALNITKAPIIFSHSGAYSISNHYRFVQDDVLKMLKENGGVMMMNFYDGYVNTYPLNQTVGTLSQVADHLDYIKLLIGPDYIGIGGDYDGIPTTPVGLEDVSKYPDLFAELIHRGWSDEDLQKLAGKNLVRAFTRAEQVRDEMSWMSPFEDVLPENERYPGNNCRTDF